LIFFFFLSSIREMPIGLILRLKVRSRCAS
jgi:hypothetical protein